MADEKKTILDDWKKLLDTFNKNVDKSLKEVRQYKQDVEQMKAEILDQFSQGQYISDDKCIILSAPRIIIGNVSKDGNLRSGGEVIIRGQKVDLNGVGEFGTINMQAPEITQRAIDPGIDGKEAVVYKASRIISQARTIVLNSQSPSDESAHNGTFVSEPIGEGIKIVSERGVTVDAAPGNTLKKTRVGNKKRAVERRITTLKAEITATQDTVQKALKQVNDLLKQEEGLAADNDLTKSNVLAIDELAAVLKEHLPVVNRALLEYAAKVSTLAELSRQKASLEKEANKLQSEAEAFKKSTKSPISLKSEKISLHCQDGDGTWRTNEGAGIDLRGNQITLRSTEEKDKTSHAEILTKKEAKGRVSIHARNVSISTADLTDATYKNGKLDNGKFPLEGNVTIRSKSINMESVDLEQTDGTGKLKETKLTDKGEINLRANKVRVKTINEKGESVGRFSVNSQKISLKATNIDGYKADVNTDDQGNRIHPDSMKSKELAKESKMLLLAETMHIGYKKDNMRSKELYMSSEEKTIIGGKKEMTFATEGAELNLNDKIAKLKSQDKMVLSAKSGTTLIGKTEFQAKLTAGDIEAGNIKAKSSINSPNIGDGTPVPSTEQPALDVKKLNIPESPE
ncbi:MAG: hypothetical protein J5688_06825 [Paludibacteraceae bacterium]|nr:hypothetical protein [Paludibacteraceae bacterium]